MCSLPVNLGRWPFSVTYCWNVWAAVTDDGNADSSSLQATCISRLLLPLQKKLYFLWQGNSPWHFFFNWLSWEAHTRQPTRLLWVQCLSAWTDMLTVSWKTNSVPLQLWETPRTWHDHQMVCYGSNHQQNSCLHYTYIYMYIWHIHVNICINRHIFEFKNLTIYFNSWSG